MIGCGDYVVTDKAIPLSPVSPRSPARDTIWTNIADSIDASEITDSTKLDLVVKHLRSVSKITDNEVAKIKSRLPDAFEKHRELTKADSDSIRGL